MVESSIFGSEFVAFIIAMELLVSLTHKLRVFGVPIDVPADVFCENHYMQNNVTLPVSAEFDILLQSLQGIGCRDH